MSSPANLWITQLRSHHFVTLVRVSKTSPCQHCGGAVAQPERGRRRRYCSRSCQARAYRARRDHRAPQPRRRPSRLTAVGITRTAVELADRDGLDGLTMRRLAGELGVATAALYRHFPEREALLGAMTELVIAEAPEPRADPADWRAAITAEAEAEWQLYLHHPWLLPVLARAQPPLGPALFDTLERSFAALDGLGLSHEETLTVYLTCSGLVQGLALLWSSERAERLSGAEVYRRTTTRAEVAELLDPALRPALHKIFTADPPGPELDFDALLRRGVGLLLDGVALHHSKPTA
ncbi:TetR family transcriptional regulator [Nocardia puris]|uniref:TetR family transcriptional regulator n=1 Tax=Nocardia puris TaxID=208602 RepID=A0A366DM29_9NOCA|nr:TetR family transcriptional regulator [Nocardia puris]